MRSPIHGTDKMRGVAPAALIALAVLLGCGSGDGDADSAEALTNRGREILRHDVKALGLDEVRAALRPLQDALPTPGPSDWLSNHDEPGQSYLQYVGIDPVRPTAPRDIIAIQPLGPFTESQRRIVTLAAEYLGRYFDRAVRVLDDLPLSVVPDSARRRNPDMGQRQLLTTHILRRLLPPKLSDDAACIIAFTAVDLWPGKGWNFVFGQASPRDRVGVWSINRNGDPDASEAAFRLCLSRTLKTATHEVGHMFSMRHCTAFMCNMGGSNHRAESDRQPLTLCAECLPKLAWATGTDPIARYDRLIAFSDEHGLSDNAARLRRYHSALSPKPE